MSYKSSITNNPDIIFTNFQKTVFVGINSKSTGTAYVSYKREKDLSNEDMSEYFPYVEVIDNPSLARTLFYCYDTGEFISEEEYAEVKRYL